MFEISRISKSFSDRYKTIAMIPNMVKLVGDYTAA